MDVCVLWSWVFGDFGPGLGLLVDYWVLGGVVDLCLEMDRLVETELAASQSNCFAELCL